MKHTTTRGAALLLGALTLCTSLQGAEDLDTNAQALVHYQGKSFVPGDWPAGMGSQTRSEVMRWTPLARELGYRMDVAKGGRVMVLSSARFNRSVRREDRLVKLGMEAFDELVRATEDDQVIAGRPLEECVVLLRLHDRADYECALAFMGDTRPYLAPWAASARAEDGFVLRQPNCAAWIEREAKQSTQNELVHRLATCLVAARYGEPSPWLERGVAWHVELEVCKSIRTLPGAQEERGWTRMLQEAYGRRDGLRLECEDFAKLSAAGCSELEAAMAWGMVTFLAEHRPGSLGPVLADLGRYAAEHGRVVHEDGRWEVVPGYQVPVHVQSHVLNRHVAGDPFAECTGYFQLGSRYRLPAAR